jgi:peptidoglycan/xylan/chitin deacetylase (PgdA/CDA1 family)
MKLPGMRQLRGWLRRSTASFCSQAVILLYHRVFETPSDPQRLCIRPGHFAEHLEHLSTHYRVISLHELISALKNGAVPQRAVVLTFDDGYVDNLWNAKPLLERYEVPATAFIATAYVGVNREFWWDELERLLLLSPSLPEHLTVMLKGKSYTWHLGERVRRPIAKSLCQPWHVECGDDPTPRHRAYRELCRFMRPLGYKEQETVLEALHSQVGDDGQGRMSCQTLTPNEICQLAEGGLIEIGAHTVHHPVLSAQAPQVQRHEMVASKRTLEAILGRTIAAFAYPYGNLTAVGETAMGMVREVGFEVACTTVSEPVTRQSDPSLLPRFLVRDWDGDKFATQLGLFFNR